MIPITNTYTYTHLERITDDTTGIRHYIDPQGNHLPSVTTILSATKDDTGLKAWRDWVGDDEANRVTKEATNLGSLMHEHLENWIEGKPRPGGTNLIRTMAKDMADKIINNGLQKVTEVWGIEAPLYFPGQFAGTTDLCGTFENIPAIMDHKTANKMKKPEHVHDYFCQGAAYTKAHNKLYGTNIKKVVLFMVARDLEYKEWILEGLEFQKFSDEWERRLELYYDKN